MVAITGKKTDQCWSGESGSIEVHQIHSETQTRAESRCEQCCGKGVYCQEIVRQWFSGEYTCLPCETGEE